MITTTVSRVTAAAKAAKGSMQINLSKYAHAIIAIMLALGLTAGRAQAAMYYWDTDGNIGGFGNTAGTWGASAFWSTDGTGASTTANTTITTSDGINFGTASLALGSTAAAVGVSGTVTVNSITFGAAQTDALTLSGGTSITLGGTTPTITVNNASNTISSVVAGSSFTKAGSGTLTLSGNNTHTGTTTISAGTLRLLGANMWKTARTYFINGGAVLHLDGGVAFGTGTAATTTIDGAGTLRVTGAYAKGSATGASFTMAMDPNGLIDIQSGASFQNGGWQNINWDSNQASMNVNGVFDTWDGNAVTIDALTGSGTITKGATTWGSPILNLGKANGSGVFSGVIQNTAGALALVKVGTGTQTLSGNNTYSGTTTVSAGTLLVNGSINSAVSVANGAYLGGTGAITGTVTFVSGARATFTNSAPLRFAGTVTLNNNTAYLALSDNLAAGTYLLATNMTSSFSGTFAATPVIVSGSSVGTCTITTDARAVRLIVSPPPNLSVSVTNPINGRNFLPGSSVTATVSVVNGTMPYAVTFYTNSAVAWSTNSALTNLFNINMVALADGTYTHYATVTDSVASNATSSINTFTVAPDSTAPTPDPMTFAVNPSALDATRMVMTATNAIDAFSTPVQYYFTNTVNGNTSGWILSTVWTNTGLMGGTTYGYQVKARDAVLNETAFSTIVYAAPYPRTLNWDGGTADIGIDGNGASAGGSGTWNSSLLNWDVGVAPHVAWSATQDTAVFGGTAGTVMLGSDIQASGLTFAVSGYTIGGAYTLTLGANNSILANVASPGRTIGFADGLTVANVNQVQVGYGNSLANNALTLTNGARIFVANSTSIGYTTGANGSSGNTLTIVGGAADSIYNAGNQNVNVGYGSKALAAGNQIVIGIGGSMTNVASIDIGRASETSVANAASRNAIRVTGGKLFTSGSIRIGASSGSTAPSRTNALTVAEGGVVNVAGGLYVGVTGYNINDGGDNTTSGNSLTVTNGGFLSTKADCYIGSDADNLWGGTPSWKGTSLGNVATVGGSLNGANAAWDLGGRKLYVGYTGKANSIAMYNSLTASQGGVVTNISTLTVRADNTVALAPGGKIYATAATINGTLSVSTDDAATPSCGHLAVSGTLNVANATLNLVMPPKPLPGAVYIIGSYGTLTGLFKGTNGLPENCSLVMDYNTLKQIAVVVPPPRGTLIQFM